MGAGVFARNLLPLVQVPPAGHWDDRCRAPSLLDPRTARFCEPDAARVDVAGL